MPVLLITGANRGLGLELVRQYVADGWDVIATCRAPERASALRNLGPKIRIEPLEVTDFAAVRSLAHKLGEIAIDVAIANAGVLHGRTMRAEAVDVDAWAECFQVNTMAPLAFAGIFAPHVARSRERKMIAISSKVGSTTQNQDGGHYLYRSSKAALNSVWKAFSIDHPELICATLSPGRTKTDMIRDEPGRWETAQEPAVSAAGLRQVIARLTPADSGGFFHFDGTRLPY